MAAGYGSTPAGSGSIPFGSVNKGTEVVDDDALVISETGDATLTVSNIAISGTHAADFELTGTPTLPFSILNGEAAVNVGIKFRPRATGARSATLTVTHDASGSPVTYTLTGTGTAPTAAVDGEITNALVDAEAVDVPAPYGPLERVTDMSDLPVPNRSFKIELVDQLGQTVYATYDQLKDDDAAARQVAFAEGLNYRMHKLITDVATVNTALQAMKQTAGGPYTQDNWADAIRLLRSIDWISGYL